MSEVCIHFIDARGQLSQHKSWINQVLTETFIKARNTLPLVGNVDVIVKAGPQVIPEKGHLGYTPEPGFIYITIDPYSAVFGANHNASLERMFAHELHHAARWDGPGYGSTLGEALVTEGLAGHFVSELLGGPPEIWETLDDALISDYAREAETLWERHDYSHSDWFFGSSSIPRWTGYSLGYAIVEQFLAAHPDSTAAALASEPAVTFRHCLRPYFR